MDNKVFQLFIGGIIIFALISTSVVAQLGTPHKFKGYVTANGAPAPDGLIITAKVNGIEVGSTTTLDGAYGRYLGDIDYTREFNINDNNGDMSGKIIKFYVNGIEVAQYVFSNGAVTELDLSVTGDLGICGDGYCSSGETCSSCQTDCGTCPSTGGGSTTSGSSGSSGGSSGGLTTAPETCTEDWSCSDWSACSKDGLQFRSCVDSNGCGTNKNEPIEEQSCTYQAQERPIICSAGNKVCEAGQLKECMNGEFWTVLKTCEYGCDADAVACLTETGEVETTGIFDSISSFFAGLFGGDSNGDSVTGASVANSAMLILGVIVVIVLIGLALFFKFR